MDVGCGEGALLACLANPAACLAPTSPEAIYEDDYYEIHVTKIGGLDVDASELEWAIKGVSCDPEDEIKSEWYSRPPRWENLDVKLWNSGFEEVNDEFRWDGSGDGYECIVSTEVYVPE